MWPIDALRLFPVHPVFLHGAEKYVSLLMHCSVNSTFEEQTHYYSLHINTKQGKMMTCNKHPCLSNTNSNDELEDTTSALQLFPSISQLESANAQSHKNSCT